MEEDVLDANASECSDDDGGRSDRGRSPSRDGSSSVCSDPHADGDLDRGEGCDSAGQYPPIASQPGGYIPASIVNQHAFLSEPVNIGKKGPEGDSSREFAEEKNRNGLGVRADDAYAGVVSSGAVIADTSPAEAGHQASQHASLFTRIDRFEIDEGAFIDSAGAAAAGADAVSGPRQYLASAVGDLEASVPRASVSHTVVIDAAAFLIRRGVLNAKGQSHVNVKQAVALMHVAFVLQENLSAQWVAEDLLPLPSYPLNPRPLLLAMLGGAGTGKTTTLCVIEALLNYFYGDDAMQKSAPTNTAARLSGGDTCHAVYKVNSNVSLRSRKGKLSSRVLQRFRKRWKKTRAHAIDEISMLAQDLLHKIDYRSRAASSRYDDVFGALHTILLGDFNQLTVVGPGAKSVAQRPDGAMAAGEGDDGAGATQVDSADDITSKRRRAREHKALDAKAGYDL